MRRCERMMFRRFLIHSVQQVEIGLYSHFQRPIGYRFQILGFLDGGPQVAASLRDANPRFRGTRINCVSERRSYIF